MGSKGWTFGTVSARNWGNVQLLLGSEAAYLEVVMGDILTITLLGLAGVMAGIH